MHLLVLFDHFFLLQALDGDGSSRFLLAAEPYFPEGPFADDAEALEVFLADFLAFPSQFVHLLLEYVLFGLLLFLEGEVELANLVLEGFPVFEAFLLLESVEVVFFFDVAFDFLGFGAGGFADQDLPLHILFS